MRPEELLETVRVKAEVSKDNPNGVVTINKSEFLESEHELYHDPVVEAEEPKAPKASAKSDAKPWAPKA